MSKEIINNYRFLMEKLQPLLRPEDAELMRQMELLATGKKTDKPVASIPGRSKPNHRQRVQRYL